MKPVISRGWTMVSCILAALIAVSALSISLLMSPWFSWTSNDLSDLGNYTNGIPASLVLNFGLVATGICLLVFSIGLFRFSDTILMNIGILFFVVGSLMLMGVGLFPITAGPIHFGVSMLFFVSIFISMLITGLNWLISTKTRWLGLVSVFMPVIPIMIWTLPWEGVAVPETVSAISVASWTFLICWLIYEHKL